MQANKPPLVVPTFAIGHLSELSALAASVYATMLFPEGDRAIDRFACAQLVGLDWRARIVTGNVQEAMPVLRHELVACLDFYRRTSYEDLMAQRNDALSAGQLLKLLLLLQKTDSLDASLKKAVSLMVKLEAVGDRTLMNRWARFKSVSHLWAAYNEYCIGFQTVSADWVTAAWHSFMTDPKPVLAIAQNFRAWAIAPVPKGNTAAPTLKANQTWAIPDHIGVLPNESFFAPQQLYEGLTSEAKELLGRYRRK
jgi:hypothetical protein